MANYNLTNQAIEDSFQPLLQIDSGSALRDGSGSLVDNLIVTASFALTASFAENAGTIDTGSLLTTASFDNGTRDLTFTKGDSSTFLVNIPGASIDTGSFATTGSNNFFGNQNISGSVESTINLSNTHLNPQTITDNVTIPTGLNGLIIGETTIVGDYTVEGNSEIYIFTEPPLGEYLTTASYLVDSSSFDTRINNISFDTSSLATTGSNTFNGTQIITGSLFLSSSNQGSRGGVVFQVSDAGGPKSKNGVHIDGRLSVDGPVDFQVLDMGSLFVNNLYASTGGPNAIIQVRTNMLLVESEPGGPFTPVNMTITGSAFVSSSVNIGEKLNLTPNDPLPAGVVGDLAVSGSELYFNDGTNWRTVNLT